MVTIEHLEHLGVLGAISDAAGKEWVCDCPLCGKSRKFYVEQATGRWHCFVCNASGGSLRTLAKELGSELPANIRTEQSARIDRNVSPPSHEVQAAWRATIEIGQKWMTDATRNYLQSRLPAATIAKFSLSEASEGLIAHLVHQRKIPTELCVEAGVLTSRDDFKHVSVRWPGSVIIPVCDADGRIDNLLYRLPEKLAQRLGGDRYRSLPGRSRGLFNPAAARDIDELFVTEGPMDAMTLDGLGYRAVALPAASIVKPRFGDSFEGKRAVYVLVDNDDAGEKARARLRQKFPRVRFVDVTLPDGVKDVNEWVVKHHATRDDVAALLAKAKPAATPAVEVSAPPTSAIGFALTELGNAERLAARHRDSIRFVGGRGGWHLWDGLRWAVDKTGATNRMAVGTVRSIYEEAQRASTKEAGDALWKHAVRSEAAVRIEAMLKLAAFQEGIVRAAESFDADTWLFNCLNGTVDLRTGTLRANNRDDLITKLAPVAYVPTAQCPVWDLFLERVVPSPDVRRFLQRAAGYCLTGNTSEHCIFMFYGAGANGKSTALEALRLVAGEYARVADSSTFLAKKNDRIPNDVAALVGARMVTVSETEGGARLAAALLKNVTGGDMVTARFLYQEFFEFKPQFKLLLATNHKPEVADTSEGFWRRIRLIPFEVQIPPDERDKRLSEKLRAELPGILRWAIEGCLAWQRDGLGEPDEVRRATAAYREEQDPVGTFIAECCVVDAETKSTSAELHAAYDQWARSTSETPMSIEELGRALGSRGLKPCKVDRRRGWCGIRLRTAAELSLASRAVPSGDSGSEAEGPGADAAPEPEEDPEERLNRMMHETDEERFDRTMRSAARETDGDGGSGLVSSLESDRSKKPEAPFPTVPSVRLASNGPAIVKVGEEP